MNEDTLQCSNELDERPTIAVQDIRDREPVQAAGIVLETIAEFRFGSSRIYRIFYVGVFVEPSPVTKQLETWQVSHLGRWQLSLVRKSTHINDLSPVLYPTRKQE